MTPHITDYTYSMSFSSVQSLSCVRLFVTPWTAALQASLSHTISQSLPKSTFIACHPAISSSDALFSCPQSCPASGKDNEPILTHAAATAAKSLQSCPTLCDPIDGSPPGSPVPGILQARVLEWGAISFYY